VFRTRIGHLMAFIALFAPGLLCVRILFENATGAEQFGRKMTASVFLIFGIIVVSCFTVAYLRGSPEERMRLFSPPPEYAELRAEIAAHWGKVVALVRRCLQR
jgi:hypothetical protein